MAVLCPIGMALPPRKMDIRFLVLTGGFSLSTDQLLKKYTGQGIYERFTTRAGSVFDTGLPEKARETQRRLREEKARVEAQLSDEERKRLEESRRPSGLRGLFAADEGDGWKEKRLEAHRKGLEEGKGISDLIMEHVTEAFGKEKKDGEDDSKQEKK